MWFGVHLGGHLEFWKCQAVVIITPNGFLNYMVWSTQKRKETIVNRHCKVSRKNWSVPLDYPTPKLVPTPLHLYIHIGQNNMLHVRRHPFHEFYISLFIFSSWYWRHYDISAIFCLLHYSILSVMKKNVWHIIEWRTIDASIDQWHSRLKTRICAEVRIF